MRNIQFKMCKIQFKIRFKAAHKNYIDKYILCVAFLHARQFEQAKLFAT